MLTTAIAVGIVAALACVAVPAWEIRRRRRAEAAVRASEQRLRTLLYHLPTPVQGYDCDGIVKYWNPASEEVYGYTAEEAVGRNLDDLIIPPEVKPIFHECIRACRTLTESGEFLPAGEIALLRKDGTRVPVFSTHTAVCTPGQPPMLFCLDLDLTASKQTEEALHQRMEELRDRNAELTMFNDVAVGREMRMIELKKEINALCAAANQPPRYVVHEEEPT